MSFLENMKANNNFTTTENGAVAHKNTLSGVLDLFSKAGSMVYRQDEAVVRTLVSKAYYENPVLALKTLFLLRDVREGNGVRSVFRIGFHWLAENEPEVAKALLPIVSEYGRWDDIFVLLDTELRSDVVALVSTQLATDKSAMDNGEGISLLGKWMPSINTSSEKSRNNARILAKDLGLSHKDYRKTLSALRKYGNVLEVKLSDKEYGDIEYDKLPSKASLRYRNAFHNNDSERYNAFLESLVKGEVSVNTGTLYPNDILKEMWSKGLINGGWDSRSNSRSGLSLGNMSPQDEAIFNGMWKDMVDNFSVNTNGGTILGVADLSESMTGTPMQVAIALTMFLAQTNEGAFAGNFLSFADEPELHTLRGKTFTEQLRNFFADGIKGYSTNIEATFDLILNTAVKGNFRQEDMPSTIVYFSDMQFNPTWHGGSHSYGQYGDVAPSTTSFLESMREKFAEKGYELPHIVFWDVNGGYNNTPATKMSENITLVSGYSQNLLKDIMLGQNLNPFDAMVRMLSVPRYDLVEQTIADLV